MNKKLEYQEFVVGTLDIASVILSFFITIKILGGNLLNIEWLIIILTHFLSFYLSKVMKHFLNRGYFEELKALIHYTFIFLGILGVSFTIGNQAYLSTKEVLISLFLNLCGMWLIHSFCKFNYVKSRTKINSRKIILLTTSKRLQYSHTQLFSNKPWDGQIVALSLLNCKNRDGFDKVAKLPFSDVMPEFVEYEKLEEYIRINVVDEIFIDIESSTSMATTNLISELIAKYEISGVDISVNIGEYNLEVPIERKMRKIAGYSVITFSHKFYSDTSIILKRLIDILGSIIGLGITLLLSLFIVPAICIESRGNPFFVQKRVGKNGRQFNFYKFRSMVVGAESKLTELESQNEMEGLMFKLEKDPRITKVGRIIRKLSLDEFPQFLNVLKGDMSLVGTRPPTVEEYYRYELHHKRRLSFKPGITGLWQVSGRNEITDFEQVVKLDVEYINEWNLWLDIKILLLTIIAIFRRRGAK